MAAAAASTGVESACALLPPPLKGAGLLQAFLSRVAVEELARDRRTAGLLVGAFVEVASQAFSPGGGSELWLVEGVPAGDGEASGLVCSCPSLNNTRAFLPLPSPHLREQPHPSEPAIRRLAAAAQGGSLLAAYNQLQPSGPRAKAAAVAVALWRTTAATTIAEFDAWIYRDLQARRGGTCFLLVFSGTTPSRRPLQNCRVHVRGALEQMRIDPPNTAGFGPRPLPPVAAAGVAARGAAIFRPAYLAR